MDFDNSLDTISPDVSSQTITIGGTGSIQIPSGTTAQRPGTPSAGMIRYNTSNTLVEGYIGSSWSSLQLQSINLDALSAMSTTGLLVRTGSGTYSARTLTSGNTGRISITDGDGISGNPTVDLATVVSTGTSPVITYDAYGRVTAGSNTLTTSLNEAPVTTVASAATVDLGAATSNTVYVTGTSSITSFGTIAAGALRRVRFAGALVLTYNASSLILPTAANITTAANDVAEFVSLGAGNWICTSYTRASGQALSGGSGAAITVQDEGVNVTTSLSSLNFTGAGVAASGTSSVTVSIPESPKSITIPSPTNTDNFTILYTSSSIPLSSIRSVLRGSSTPSVTFSIRYGTDRSAAGTEVVTSGITCTNTTTGLSTTTFNNGTIPSNNYIWITVSAVSGTVTEINVTMV